MTRMPLFDRTNVLVSLNVALMTRSVFAFLLSSVVLVNAAYAADQGAESDAAKEIEAQWNSSGWAMVEKFCIECHNADYQEAEVDLSSMKDSSTAPENAVMWNRVLQMVRFGAMPPEDALLPTEAERRELGDAIDRSLYAVSCDLRPKSGRVTARRLNRAEYQNTVRDLLGVQYDVSDDFPADEVGGGFDNNADVLSMPPLLLEKYIEAAEKVAAKAILDPSELKATEQERSGDGIGVVGDTVTESFYGRILKKDAFAWVEFDLPTEGRYRFRVQGAAWSEDDEPKSFVVYDGEGNPIYADRFKHTDSRGGGSDSANFARDFKAGKHFFIVAPIDSLKDELKGSSDPEKLAAIEKFKHIGRLNEAEIKKGREQFGTPLTVDYRRGEKEGLVFMVRRLAIEGPTEFSKSAYPASHYQIIRKTPPYRDRRIRDVQETAAYCIKPLAEKLFRGPVDDETVARYAVLVKATTDRDESFQKGMRVALTALLVSPRFLFRVELPEEGSKPDEGGDYRVSNYQLASRLSYFLWSSAPDDTLLRLAKEGKLQDEKELKRQVDRMLADPRSRSLGTEFAAQWLGLRNLVGVTRDSKLFPKFDAKLTDSMAEETKQFFAFLLRENRPAGDLIDADFTFVNKPLADFYGLPFDGKDSGNEFKKVSLASTPRRGVLTHASVLTLTSYPTRTSPVQRGKWILENIIGTPPPEPPPNVPELEATKADEGATVREQLALHRANPACASCHKVMDQLGFGFEQFDAIGQFRTEPNIDASGELPGGRVFEGGLQLASILRKTESKRFATTVTEKLLGFALGRELSPDDRCITDKIVADNEANDYRLADLVKSVVLSRPFQYFQPENAKLAVASSNTEPKR